MIFIVDDIILKAVKDDEHQLNSFSADEIIFFDDIPNIDFIASKSYLPQPTVHRTSRQTSNELTTTSRHETWERVVGCSWVGAKEGKRASLINI